MNGITCLTEHCAVETVNCVSLTPAECYSYWKRRARQIDSVLLWPHEWWWGFPREIGDPTDSVNYSFIISVVKNWFLRTLVCQLLAVTVSSGVTFRDCLVPDIGIFVHSLQHWMHIWQKYSHVFVLHVSVSFLPSSWSLTPKFLKLKKI